MEANADGIAKRSESHCLSEAGAESGVETKRPYIQKPSTAFSIN